MYESMKIKILLNGEVVEVDGRNEYTGGVPMLARPCHVPENWLEVTHIASRMREYQTTWK